MQAGGRGFESHRLHHMASIVLLLWCRDRPGIVAGIASWVTSIGGNIIDAQQHTDAHDAMFFQRVEFEVPSDRAIDELHRSFGALAQELQLSYRFGVRSNRPRTVVLVSKPLHCAMDLLSRAHLGNLSLDVQALISNHPDASSLAEMFAVDFVHLPVDDGDDGRATQEVALAQTLESLRPELVILARYMLVLPPAIVRRWNHQMINIHHSFLPAFAGANPYRQAHDRGVKVVGATSHYVSEGLDEGPIISQEVVPVSHRDGVESLARHGRDLETIVLARAVRAHIDHRVLVFGNRTIVFD